MQNRAKVGLCKSEQRFLTGYFIEILRPIRLIKIGKRGSMPFQQGRGPVSRMVKVL
jgi:hypothetical protein